MAVEKGLVNVILVSIGFFFMVTAMLTTMNISKAILNSVAAEDPDFTGDGHITQAITFCGQALFTLLAPLVIGATGPRVSMFIGALLTPPFLMAFIWPRTWLLYFTSGLAGAGGGLMFAAQGNYLALNSRPDTIARNSSILWGIIQSSIFFGNLFVFIQFRGVEVINADVRTAVCGGLTAASLVGVIIVALLRPAVKRNEGDQSDDAKSTENLTPGNEPVSIVKKSFQLFISKEFLILISVFVFTGVMQSFYAGVYGSSVGFTLQMAENVKHFIGLVGIFIGLGEIVGGLLFSILGRKTILWGRLPIVALGCVVCLINYVLIYLNLPSDAPFGDTNAVSVMQPNAAVAMLCAFMLGFGNACYNTQLYSLLGDYYANNSASAFALFKFVQSIASAASFFYSSVALLYVQLAIMGIFAILALISFRFMEKAVIRKTEFENSKYIFSQDVVINEKPKC